MKHVWILNHYAVDPSEAGGTRHFHLARRLTECGWTASIIAASTDLTGRQRFAPGERTRYEKRCGVPFLWLRTPGYRSNGIDRMLNMLAYLFRALSPAELLLLAKPDLIIGSTVHPFAGLAGALLARRHGVPFVFEVRDLWPRTLIDLGRLRENSPVAVAMRCLERCLYRRAARVVTLLPRAVDYIERMGGIPGRVIWIPNGVEVDDFGPPAPLPSRTGSTPVLMYLGAHGQANGLEVLLEAIARIRAGGSAQVMLRLLGSGPAKQSLMALAERLSLDSSWVSFEEPVPKARIPDVAAQADAFVICVRDLPALYRYGISMNKLYDYLAAGRPIVIASAAVNNPVAEAGAGITVPPEDPEALAQAIVKLFGLTIEARQEMGRRARAYVEEHNSYRHLARCLASQLDACLREAR